MLPAAVRAALATASGAKALSGFVTLFLSFLLWDQPLPGISSVLALGLVVAAAGVGNALGSFAGNRIGDRSPTVIASAGLLAAIAVGALVTAYYSVPTLILLGLVSGAFGQLAKLCLDALIQDATDDETRAQVFSWSETRLQAAWVGGGALGIAMPLIARLGFGAVTASGACEVCGLAGTACCAGDTCGGGACCAGGACVASGTEVAAGMVCRTGTVVACGGTGRCSWA